MIKSKLSQRMGEKRVRIIDVARATGMSRNFLAKLYNDHAIRIELNDLAKLCAYFRCCISDLLEYFPEPADSPKSESGRKRKPRRRQALGETKP